MYSVGDCNGEYAVASNDSMHMQTTSYMATGGITMQINLNAIMMLYVLARTNKEQTDRELIMTLDVKVYMWRKLGRRHLFSYPYQPSCYSELGSGRSPI